MGTSIDELCGRFGVIEIAPSECRSLDVSHEEYPNEYDSFALPATRKIAPIVCGELKGVKYVLELGCGTGLRLLYYALNNHDTKFIAIDNDKSKIRIVEQRIKKLGVNNVQINYGDMYKLDPSLKLDCVLAIDCIPEKVPKYFSSVVSDYQHFTRTSFVLFGKMIDKTKSPAFLASVHYGTWSDDHEESYMGLGKAAGLSHQEFFPFSYKKIGEEENKGTVIIASP